MSATLNPLISAGAYLVTRVEVDSLERSLDGLFIGTVEEFSNRWAGSAVQDKEDNWHIVPTGDNVQDAGTGRRVKMYSGGAFGRAKFHTRGWFEENAVKIFFGALTLPRGSGSKAAHSVSGEATTIEPVAQVIGHHKEEVGPGGRPPTKAPRSSTVSLCAASQSAVPSLWLLPSLRRPPGPTSSL